MLVITLQNVENIFFNEEIFSLLPDLRHIYDQWLLSQRIPSLRTTRLQSMINMINSISPDHIKILEKHLKDNIILNKINYNIVNNLSLPLNFDPNKELSRDFKDLAISRDNDQIYICMWR